MTFQQLLQKYGNTEKSRKLLFFISKKVKNLTDYLIKKDKKIDFSSREFGKLLNESIPLERIFKKVNFLGKEFVLLDNVFCPRPETELLADILIGKVNNKRYKYIDICSGTGIIGISVALHSPKLYVHLLDISKQAVNNIKSNLELHGVQATVYCEDWLDHLMKNDDYEVISANFPYIGKNDFVDQSVLDYDPHEALFADQDGWSHYDKLFRYLKFNDYWKIVILECSQFHEHFWTKTKLENPEFKFFMISDLNGLLRIAVIERKYLVF